MTNQYSFYETIQNIFYIIVTKIFYRPARLIRYPFYCRGANKLSFKKGFTTGRNCRFDLYNANTLKHNQKTLFFGENCKIGDRVHIVALEKVEIGDNCLLASNIFISDTSHGSYEELSSPFTNPDERDLVSKPVKIGDRVWIGENAVILPGVTIGDGVVIGANSVVNKSIENNTIVAGVPAKVIKKYKIKNKSWEREKN